MKLYYFDEKEFREWFPFMSPRLLVMLDIFRHLIESPIHISKNEDSLGRHDGESESAHNVDKWSEVLAIDCFVERAKTKADVLNVIEIATMLGFTGIGIYPYWTNNNGEKQCGFHFDVRPSRHPNNPASWGRVNGKRVSLHEALKHVQ